MNASIIDIEHVRRSRRLFRVVVERYGIGYFAEKNDGPFPRVRRERLAECLELAIDWMERRTGRRPVGTTVDVMARDLKRHVLIALAQAVLDAQEEHDAQHGHP